MALVMRNLGGSSIAGKAWMAMRTGAPSSTEAAMDQFIGYYESAGAAQAAIRRSMPGLSIRFQREDQTGDIEAYAGYAAWVT